MAMTTEQKVAKKTVTIDKLKYTKGVAIVIRGVNEIASEYDSHTDFDVRIYFKTKAAINRIGKVLGEARFPKKNILAQFERGINSYGCQLSGYEMYSIEAGQNIIREVLYDHSGDSSGRRYQVSVNPTKPLSEREKEYYTGSLADSEPLVDYYEYLQQQIVEGKMGYVS